MNFFKKRLAPSEVTEVDSRVEVVASQEATRSQIEEVKKANEASGKVFDANHFRLYLVVGGHNPHSKRSKPRKA